MGVNFGTGRPLTELVSSLRNPEQRIAMILDVTERNSVIEGLPPFTEEFRRQLRDELRAMILKQQTAANPHE
jgi:hypothetical protein